jgi:hypothetical protein
MNIRTLALIAVATALAACGSGKSSSAGSPQPSAAVPMAVASSSLDCNGKFPVWVLQSPKVYLMPGDHLYGKTKHGQYLCKSQAHAEGYRPARRPFRRHPTENPFSE